jgi:hypothetical protein
MEALESYLRESKLLNPLGLELDDQQKQELVNLIGPQMQQWEEVASAVHEQGVALGTARLDRGEYDRLIPPGPDGQVRHTTRHLDEPTQTIVRGGGGLPTGYAAEVDVDYRSYPELLDQWHRRNSLAAEVSKLLREYMIHLTEQSLGSKGVSKK